MSNAKKPEAETSSPLTLQDQEAISDFDNVFKRMKLAVGARSDTDLARTLGIKQSSVSSAKTRQQMPSNWITYISMTQAVSADWLLYGIGEQSLSRIAPPADQQKHIPGDDDIGGTKAEAIMIPQVKAKIDAVKGSFVHDKAETGKYAFRRDWAHRMGSPGHMVLMELFEESMEPQIQSGDTVLIDQSQTEVIMGCIYAVGMDDDVVVRYVDRKPGRLILRGANERWNDIEVDLKGGHASESIRIIGRVLWWCREVG